MPEPSRAWPDNAPGAFYVDETCIDCDLCRTTAPDCFSRSENGYSFVSRQPETERERRDCDLARRECPVEAIAGPASPEPSEG
ncbi:MAG: ferredoxin [Planctomycetes bacterium]|nr:ferredoxin [Planctomycetota bacterium]